MCSRTKICTNLALPDVLKTRCDSPKLENNKFRAYSRKRKQLKITEQLQISINDINMYTFLEHIIYTSVIDHLDYYNYILCIIQRSFRAKHSCESELITNTEFNKTFSRRRQIGTIF